MRIILLLLFCTALGAIDDMNLESAQKATEQGFIELKDNRLNDALETFHKAIVFQNSYAEAHMGLGITYFRLKDYKEAARRLKTAIIFNNSLITAWDYLGRSYEMAGDKEKALETYLKALDIDPLFSKHAARFDKYVSLELLPAGIERRQEQIKALQSAKSLEGKSIYVENDTPIIDTLVLARYLLLLSTEKKAKVYFEPGSKLQPLFAKGMPGITIVDWLSLAGEQAYDYKITLSALPTFFNTTLSTIPYPEGYIFVAPELKNGKVGVVWRFDGEDPEATDISLDQVAALAPPGSSLFLLQEAPRNAKDSMTPLGFRGQSLDEIRGMISQMEEIIAVDGSIARLAAAMGKRVTIIVPTPGQWLWFLEGVTTPWFKNVELKRVA